jgi:hypothetical protein
MAAEGFDRVDIGVANISSLALAPLHRQSLNLSIGYCPDPLEEVFVGTITGVSFLPRKSTVRIRGTALRMRQGTKDRAFPHRHPTVGNFPS